MIDCVENTLFTRVTDNSSRTRVIAVPSALTCIWNVGLMQASTLAVTARMSARCKHCMHGWSYTDRGKSGPPTEVGRFVCILSNPLGTRLLFVGRYDYLFVSLFVCVCLFVVLYLMLSYWSNNNTCNI